MMYSNLTRGLSTSIIGVVLLVIGAFFMVTPAHVQNLDYSSGSSELFDFGGVPGFSGGLGTGGTETLLEVNMSGSGGANMLGCAGVDILSYFNITFNVGEFVENFKAYIKTMAAKLLLTTLFVSPQIAAIFDTIQAIGNARLDMFKANCDLSEIKAVAEDFYNKIRSKCVEDLAKEYGRAEAEQRCGDNYNKESSKTLAGAAIKLLDFACANSDIGEVLRTSTYCGNSSSAICGMTVFIPKMRLSVSGGMGSSQFNCSSNIGGPGDTADAIGSALMPFSTALFVMNRIHQVRIMNPIFDVISGATEAGVSYSAKRMILNKMNSKAPDGKPVNIIPDDVSAGILPANQSIKTSYFNANITPVTFANPEKKESESVIQFKKYISCTQDKPYTNMLQFVEELNKEHGTTFSTNAEDYFDKTELPSLSDILAIDKSKYVDAALDLEDAEAIMETALNCVSNHYVHVGVSTAIELETLPVSYAQAYKKAASYRASILAVELVMRFVKHKIMEGFVEIASQPGVPYYKGGGCPKEGKMISKAQAVKDRTGACEDENWPYPTGMMEGIKMMAEIVENQIQAMGLIKQEQDAFAKISALIAKKRGAAGK